MKQRAIDYFNRDRMAHIDMLEVLQLPACEVVLANESGALLHYGDLLLLAHEPGKAENFLPLMAHYFAQKQDRLVVLHSDELKNTLERDFAFQTVMECRHAVYCSVRPIPYTLPAGAEIRALDQSHADFVHAHYHMVDDIGYIKDRIDAGMIGVFFGSELAGFAGTHEERPMGLLEILPQFQRRGLAYALEAHLINSLLSQKRVPFCQVALYNEASIRLQRKLGLALSERIIYWLARGEMK